jgi:hypothetical protein
MTYNYQILIKIAVVLLFLDHTTCYVELPLEKANSPTIRGNDRVLYLAPNYVTMGNIMNLQYNAKLTIGPTNQAFTCQVDTGSAWFWVTSKGQTGDNFTTNHYNCAGSATCTTTSNFVPIVYGSGSANGTMAYDTVGMGGSGYLVTKQAFLLINSTSNFTGFFADGLFGLGFNAMTGGIYTFIDNLKVQGVIQNRTFSIYLSNNPNGNDSNSVLILGGNDLKYTTASSLTFLPVIDTFYWAVGMVSASLGTTNIPLSAASALIDSGTSLLVAPTSDFLAVLSAFRSFDSTCAINTGFIECRCGTNPYSVNNYPDLTFILGSNAGVTGTFKLPAIQYVAWDSNYCYPLIQSLDGIDLWIMGDVFMSYYYTNFNQDTMQIGFGPANPTPNLAKPTKPVVTTGSEVLKSSYCVFLLMFIGAYIL